MSSPSSGRSLFSLPIGPDPLLFTPDPSIPGGSRKVLSTLTVGSLSFATLSSFPFLAIDAGFPAVFPFDAVAWKDAASCLSETSALAKNPVVVFPTRASSLASTDFLVNELALRRLKFCFPSPVLSVTVIVASLAYGGLTAEKKSPAKPSPARGISVLLSELHN